jgi:tetratricopeptide (TPR) repeat protein
MHRQAIAWPLPLFPFLRAPDSQSVSSAARGGATMAKSIHERTHITWSRALQAAIALISIACASAPSLPAQGDSQAAAPAIERASVENSTKPKLQQPDVALTPEQIADLQMARKQYQAAIQSYTQISPKSAALWNKLGIANQQMFLTDEAKKDYENALKIEPKNPDFMNNLGSVYYSLKDFGRAERLYRKALKINPKSALVYKNLGTALLAENKFKKGWECYQTALAIEPDIFERVNQLRIGQPTPTQKRGAMNYYLAKSYAHVGMNDLAVNYLRMAIDEGFTDRKKILADKEFASLRGLNSFERLIAEQQIQKN